MSGKELAGRLIAIEAAVLALGGEFLATLPPDQAQTVLATMKSIAHDMIDQLAPDFSPTPPVVKETAKFADQYVDVWGEMLMKVTAKIKKAAALPPPSTNK